MHKNDLLLCSYRIGDIAMINSIEADPWGEWGPSIERGAGGLRTVLLGTKVVASFGFVIVSPGVADSLAVIDRVAVVGHGAALAKLIATQTLEWMRREKVHRAAATCSPSDRAAQVFLRAIGYRRECILEAAAADGADLMQFKLIRR